MLITEHMKLLASSSGPMSMLHICVAGVFGMSNCTIFFGLRTFLVELHGLVGGNYEIIVNSAVLLNSISLQCSDADIPSTQTVMQELIFAMDGVGGLSKHLGQQQALEGV